MLENYRKLEKLGEGGFGEVFLAIEKYSERKVAIKKLRIKRADEQELMEHEIKTISLLKHPNVVTYYHCINEGQELYLVMEYCENGSLRDKMRQGQLTLDEIIAYAITITKTMDYIHKKGIVHHDIKPDNILFDDENTLKISDFGIANTLGGTKAFLAPEMFDYNPKKRKDSRVDIYALGITLFMLATGRYPFNTQDETEIMTKLKSLDINFEGVPQWLQNIILKSIHLTPELRFQEMWELKEALSAKSVPLVLSNELLEAGNLAMQASKILKRKSWKSMLYQLEYADKEKYKNNVSIKCQLGRYYLYMNKLEKAKEYFEVAKSLNPRINIQKELGTIYLETGNYPAAISLLSDHINLNPADMEAHNLLVKCYYMTDRFEAAIDHNTLIWQTTKEYRCFYNNQYISRILQSKKKYLNVEFKYLIDPILAYNNEVVFNRDNSWEINEEPTLKSKLIYEDFSYNNFLKTNNEIQISMGEETINYCETLITLGRSGYGNDFSIAKSVLISRLHLVIINRENDVWLYNLSRLKTYVDGILLGRRKLLYGLHEIRISDFNFTIKSDTNLIL